jgi:hypothetical protein
MPTFSVNKMLFLFFFALISGACQLDRNKKVDRTRFTFKASPDTRTFFLNLRMIYYDRETKKGSQVVAYRFKKRIQDSTQLHVNATIVLNGDTQDALLFVETTQVRDRLDVSIGNTHVALVDKTRVESLEFCTLLYEGIMADQEIFLEPEHRPLFVSVDERESFIKVVSDY